MAIEKLGEDGVVITGKRDISLFRLLQLKSALGLEVKGLKFSRGSIYAAVKREFNLSGNKQKVYEQFCKIVEQKGAERNAEVAASGS